MKMTKEKSVKTAKRCKNKQQLNEFRHDGLHSAANSRRNPTDRATVYYIGVDQYSDNFSGYDGYVTSDGNLTAPNDFKKAGVTKLPATLKNAVAKAVAKYGKKYYIFVFKEEYSYGAQTHKSHARPFVIDIWYPDGQYWKYGMKPLESLNEDEAYIGGKYLYVTENNPSFKGMVRKIGASGVKKVEDPYQFESLRAKLSRYSTCVVEPWEKAYQIMFQPAEPNTIETLEQELFDLAVSMGAKRYGNKELFSISDNDMKHIIDEFLKEHPYAFLK